jgi:Uma2 family endonuclease
MVVGEQTSPKLYTLNEFEALIALPENADRRLELIAGEIVEKVTGEEHGVLLIYLGVRISMYFDQNPIGRVGSDILYRLPGDLGNERRPDLSVRITTEPMRRGPLATLPDLIIEIKSPSDTYAAMRRKAAYYLAHGTRLVWLFYPEKRLVEVYKKDADSALLDATDTLDGGDVLPGFRLPLAELWGKLPAVAEDADQADNP